MKAFLLTFQNYKISEEIIVDRRRQYDHRKNAGISFQHFTDICFKKFWIFILWAILIGGLGFALAKYAITPQYLATTEVLVSQQSNNKNSSQTLDNQQADIQMINTYKDLITSQSLLRKVSSQLVDPELMATKYKSDETFNISLKKLKKSIDVTNTQNSQMFTINVKASNAKESAIMADIVTNVFKSEIKRYMHVNNITIVSHAYVPSQPSFPNKKLFTIVGAIVGFTASFVIILIHDLVRSGEYRDRSK